MRKLFVGSLVFVFLLVVWNLYLEYDTKRFIQGLPQPRETETQHQVGTPQVRTVTPAETDKTATAALENADEPILSETPKDFTREIYETKANTVFDAEVPDIESETDNSELSPELEALFTAYDPIYQELRKVTKVLSPLIDRHIRGSHRKRDILSEALPSSVDGPERQALYAELQEIQAWKKNVREETEVLQDEKERLHQERSTLLAEYGISSWQEFNRHHGDTYTAWRSNR